MCAETPHPATGKSSPVQTVYNSCGLEFVAHAAHSVEVSHLRLDCATLRKGILLWGAAIRSPSGPRAYLKFSKDTSNLAQSVHKHSDDIIVTRFIPLLALMRQYGARPHRSSACVHHFTTDPLAISTLADAKSTAPYSILSLMFFHREFSSLQWL